MQERTEFVSRAAALDFLIPANDLNISAKDKRVIADRFAEFIKSIPAADVRPVVHGKWEFETGDGKTCVDGWVCTNCNCGFHTNVPYFEGFNFCPNCGAEMRNTAALEDAAQDADAGAMAPAT